MGRAFNLGQVLGDSDVTVAAAGTTQATATTCPAEHVNVISGTGGVVLVEQPAVTMKSVANNNTTFVAIQVYPWVGAKFNGQAVNTALNLPAGKAALFICLTPTLITAIVG